MKINITVDVDWIEEDGSIDEEVKHEIINGVKRAISKSCIDRVEKEASEKIELTINESICKAKFAIEQRAVRFVDEWLETEVNISDKWGDVQDCLTIKDLCKKTFDGLLEQKVNSNGEFVDRHRSGIRLINWLTGDRVKQVVEEKIKVINKDIDNQITKAINAGIRKNVSDKFAEMVVQTAKIDNKRLENL